MGPAKPVNRRDFLKNTLGLAAAATAFCASGCASGCAAEEARSNLETGPEPKASKRNLKHPVVVVARDPGVANGWEVDEDRLRALLSRAMRALRGSTDAREVWRSLYAPRDRVGLKVNALAGIPAVTHPELAFAVADSLRGIGIERKNIILWDRTGTDLRRGGYTLNEAGSDYRCFGTDARGVGYESDHVFCGKVGSRLSRVLTALTTAQVNMPILKDHGLAGVSGALKNWYGAIHNPNKYHGNNCDPWVADVHALPEVRGKSRLVICDALYGLCHGGPGFKKRWAWNFGGILVGTDPVAVDRIEWAIIEERRAEVGLKPLIEEGRPPKWLDTASDSDHNLGVCNLQEIERIDV
ncbi:MAG: DUF362 domain-containing protein [Candidatus Eisenbacteria sp.]|nr:DUF362 domain-containing protein [Candidatus Eisenbacteria bacterium]